jgi:hypothetical protein
MQKRVRHFVIWGLPGSTTFSPHYPINNKIFEKKKIVEHKMFVFSLQLLTETFLILRTERDTIKKNVH